MDDEDRRREHDRVYREAEWDWTVAIMCVGGLASVVVVAVALLSDCRIVVVGTSCSMLNRIGRVALAIVFGTWPGVFLGGLLAIGLSKVVELIQWIRRRSVERQIRRYL